MEDFDFETWKGNCLDIHKTFNGLYKFTNEYMNTVNILETNTSTIIDELKKSNIDNDLIKEYYHYLFICNWFNFHVSDEFNYNYEYFDIIVNYDVHDFKVNLKYLTLKINDNEEMYYLTNDDNRNSLKKCSFTNFWLFLFDDNNEVNTDGKHMCKKCEANKIIYTMKKIEKDIESLCEKIYDFIKINYLLFEKENENDKPTAIYIESFIENKKHCVSPEKISSKLRDIYKAIPKGKNMDMIVNFLKTNIKSSEQCILETEPHYLNELKERL